MYCQKCGTQNPDEATFCSKCGHNFKSINPEIKSGTSWTKILTILAIFIISIPIIIIFLGFIFGFGGGETRAPIASIIPSNYPNTSGADIIIQHEGGDSLKGGEWKLSIVEVGQPALFKTSNLGSDLSAGKKIIASTITCNDGVVTDKIVSGCTTLVSNKTYNVQLVHIQSNAMLVDQIVKVNNTNSPSTGEAQSKSISTPTPTPEHIVSYSFSDYGNVFCSETATELQKDTLFNNKFKNKYVQWTGIVKSVDTDFLGNYVLDINHCAEFRLFSDAEIIMKDDQVDKLMKLQEGDTVTYKAKLTSQGVYGNEGEIIEVQQKSTIQSPKNIIISYSDKKVNSIGDYGQAKSGMVFLVITMNIENNGYKEISTNPNNFNIIANNIKYDYSWNSADLNDELDSIALLDGGSITGSLAFEVPSNIGSFQLQYEGWSDYEIIYKQTSSNLIKTAGLTTEFISESDKLIPVKLIPKDIDFKHKMQFSPSNVKINSGATIVWRNEDDYRAFTLISSEGLFPNKIISSSKRYSYQFNTKGTYHFSINEFPEITLTVEVV